MSYDEFLVELGKAGLNVSGFAKLIEMRPNSVSNYAGCEIPTHLAIIAALLSEMQIHGVPYTNVFSRLELTKKKPRGGSKHGKFGGDKQGQLELTS